MTRRRARWLALLCGLLLIIGLRAAPHFPVATYLWLSLLFGLLAFVLAAVAWRVAAEWIGRVGAGLLLALVIGIPMAITGSEWSGALGTRMPCRRNWAWLPSYLLRASPQRSLVFSVGAATVKLCYGQPSARGRKMIGGPHVPFGRLWRTGANEPTTLRLSGPVSVAGIAVTTGRASLYSVPGPETWEIIVNGSTTQWGIESEYAGAVRDAEIGRRVVPSRSVEDYAERLTFRVEPTVGDTVALVLRWERTEVSIPLSPAP